jgi:hypothetical protein
VTKRFRKTQASSKFFANLFLARFNEIRALCAKKIWIALYQKTWGLTPLTRFALAFVIPAQDGNQDFTIIATTYPGFPLARE